MLSFVVSGLILFVFAEWYFGIVFIIIGVGAWWKRKFEPLENV